MLSTYFSNINLRVYVTLRGAGFWTSTDFCRWLLLRKEWNRIRYLWDCSNWTKSEQVKLKHQDIGVLVLLLSPGYWQFHISHTGVPQGSNRGPLLFPGNVQKWSEWPQKFDYVSPGAHFSSRLHKTQNHHICGDTSSSIIYFTKIIHATNATTVFVGVP